MCLELSDWWGVAGGWGRGTDLGGQSACCKNKDLGFKTSLCGGFLLMIPKY